MWRVFRLLIVGSALVNGAGFVGMTPQEDNGRLVLRATPYDPRVVEGLPVVLRITLENVGEAPASVYFKRGADMAADDILQLRAVDSEGKSHEVRRLALLIANITRGAGASLPVGAKLETDYAAALFLSTDHPSMRESRTPIPLSPGNYRMNVTLRCPELVQAEPFEITVVPPSQADREAAQLLKDLPYYTQGACRWPKPDAAWALGGNPREVTNRLMEILQNFGDSDTAKWLRFWKFYHDGPPEEALRYAREHREFPLSDSLMLRVAEELWSAGDYAQSREVVEELVRDFPDNNIRADIQALEKELREEEP